MKFGYLEHINRSPGLVIPVGYCKNFLDYLLSFFVCLPVGNTTSQDDNYEN